MLSFSPLRPVSIITESVVMVFLQYSRRLAGVSSQNLLVSTSKILRIPCDIRTGFATTRGQIAALSTTPSRNRRQKPGLIQRIHYLPSEKKKFDKLNAAGLPLKHIEQYLAKLKQQESDATNWSEEETQRALKLKGEGRSDDRIYELLKLQREDALASQISGEQPSESKAKAALEQWVEEDKKLASEISKWSSHLTESKARHLKGAGMSIPEIGASLLIIEAATSTTVPVPWNSHHGQIIVPEIYHDNGVVGGGSTAGNASSAVGGGADIGGAGGDGLDIGIDFSF